MLAAQPTFSRLAPQLRLRLIILALIAVSGFTLGARAEEGTPRLVRPGEATSGALLLEAAEPGLFIEAPRLATDVVITVAGPIARARVTQRFENPSDGWVEGVYVFPLPDGAAVDTLKMQIGERFIEGKIEERRKAKAIYEKAKSEGKKAALLEQERPNIFTNSVANIGPGETVIVQIEYQQTVKLDAETFSLRFPMVVGPRFNPPAQLLNASFDGDGWGVIDPVPDRARISPPVLHPQAGLVNPVTLSVDLEAGFDLGDVRSSYHKVAIARRGATAAILSVADEIVPADRDFELLWTPKAGKAPSAALFRETINGEPYYLVMITPPAGGLSAPQTPREATFVIDTSGSMGGESIRQARESLAFAIRRLKPGDSFNLIQFNSDFDQLFKGPVAVSEQSVDRALRYVAGLEARGGTMMIPALQAALRAPAAQGKLRQVVFLTDGAIGNEDQLFESIARERGDARIFTVGIGSAPNSFFMSRAAEIGQGAFTHIGAVDEVGERMGALFEKLEAPVITDITAEWPAGADASPSSIPDLYKGETLVIAAHAGAAKGTLSVAGVAGAAPWKVMLPLERAIERKGVSKLWARRRIADFELARARGGADREALDKSILDIALSHRLISRLTSLVAIDVTPSRQAGESVARADMPLNLPAAWDFEKVFGEAPAKYQREAFRAAPLNVRPEISDAGSSPAGEGRAGVQLPQTATLADAYIRDGFLLILLAGLALLWLRRADVSSNRFRERTGG